LARTTAVEKGPRCKLARLGQARALPQAKRQDAPQGDDPAVAVDLDHVLPSEGARGGHIHGQDLVGDLAAVRVYDMAVG
jgi:hypothetical protein